MSNNDISVLDLVVSNTVANGDLLILVREPNSAPSTNTILISTFLSGIYANPTNLTGILTTSNSVYIQNLPSTDPHSNNQLWSNGGVLMVSAG